MHKFPMTNRFSTSVLTAAVALTGAFSAFAVPAKPGLIRVEQADGSTINVMLRGDERSHFYLSEDGYLLTNDNDIFFYADCDDNGKIVSSGLRAHDIAKRSSADRAYLQTVDMTNVLSKLSDRSQKMAARKAPKAVLAASKGPGLFPGTHFPAMGEQKAIVILVEYQDVSMTLTDAHDYFNRMLNEPGFNDYSGTGSARDFFLECSDGQFSPQFDVFGPIKLSKNRSYYGGNDWYGNDSNPEMMVIEACQQLDSTVDFSEYDRDGDGYIDNVFIFYAGRGEASGGSSDTVWPHSWDVSSATSTPYIFDGVRLDRYGCSNEYEVGRPDGVGTFVHEFSHVMGLPDLYATSYTSAFTPGAWSALDYGPYNNNGCTPPLYGAFERYALGWMEPLPIDGAVSATLNPISSNQAGIIHTPKSNEFFLLENRQQTSWDTYIPGHGMLIWHVDYNESIWSSNTVNNSGSHQYVDIEEADNSQSEYSREGDAFPGTSNKTSFTDDTKPSMKTWSGQKLNLPITDIAESSTGIITFNVCGGAEAPASTEALDATDITGTGFTANWLPAENAYAYSLTVYAVDGDIEGGNLLPVPGYLNLQVGNVTSYAVEGLEAETLYVYTVSVGTGWQLSAPSNQVEVYTGRLPLSMRKVEVLEADNVTTSSFTARWVALEDATGYILNVYTKEDGGTFKDVCDFTNGVKNLPEGWVSTSGASYANTAYSGEAVPALRLSTNADYLMTPVYEDYIHSLKFWHRGNSSSADDCIAISALVDGAWISVANVPVVSEKGGSVVEIEELPENTVQLRIAYARTGDKGALAVDDVVVGHGSTYQNVAVEGYSGLMVGDVTEYEVAGLQDDKLYYYTVMGISIDDNNNEIDMTSRLSDEVEVKTRVVTGVDEISADNAQVTTLPGLLMVSASVPTDVTVVSVDGRVIYRGVVVSDLSLPLDRGIYIVKTSTVSTRVRIL